MKMQWLLLLFLGYDCNGQSAKQPRRPVSTLKARLPQQMAADSFVQFQNAEMILYCVPVPAGFKEDFAATEGRGTHVFKKGKQSNTLVTVRGLFRSDTTVTAATYFENSCNEAVEAAGKVIEEKKLFPSRNCFYIKGYWGNSYYSKRFMEITWLRPEEVIVYTIEMPVADSQFWYRQLDRFISADTKCR